MHYIIVNDYDYVQGGASKVAIQTANILFSKGYNVIFFCSVSDSNKSILNPNIKKVSCNQNDSLSKKNISGLIQGLNNKKAQKAFDSLLNGIEDDIVVHIHGWTKALSSSFIKSVRKRKNVRVILTLHDFFTVCPNGGFFNYKKNKICKKKPLSLQCVCSNCDSRNYILKLYRLARIIKQNHFNKFLKNIDGYISISQLQYDVLSPYLKDKKIYFAYNPTSIIKVNDDRIKAEEFTDYLYVGRVTKDKGIDLLCEYFSKINKKLNVVGTGDLEDELIEKYKENKNIVFHGWKSQIEVYKYMCNSRAIFVPSVYYEGAPLTIFESLSFGLPIAVSNLCAGKNFINERTGILFDPYDYNQFEQVINDFSSDTKIKFYSENSFAEYWKNPFDENRYYNSLMDIYKDIFEVIK